MVKKNFLYTPNKDISAFKNLRFWTHKYFRTLNFSHKDLEIKGEAQKSKGII